MIDLHHGDCLDIMPTLEADSVDTVICDPPYGLSFMGKDWDHGIPGERFWREALRVAKPGAMLLAFGGTRTFHRLACAIEDAGWELRDTIGLPHESGDWGDCPWLMAWVYGSGFPKSHDISKAIDKHGGQRVGWFGQWLRDWREENGISQKEVAALFPSKTGGLTGCVANWELGFNMPTAEQFSLICSRFDLPFDSIEEAEREVLATKHDGGKRGVAILGTEPKDYAITAPATPAAETWHGWGTALKPAFEPVILAMKPLDGTFAQNALQHGVAGLWIDGARVEANEDRSRPPRTPNAIYGNGNGTNTTASSSHPSGRWPANLIHDGSDEVLAGFPVTTSTAGMRGNMARHDAGDDTHRNTKPGTNSMRGHNDTGSAARFFYCAKSSRSERNAGLEGMAAVKVNDGRQTPIDNAYQRGETLRVNSHPTVKPIALMRYLARLTKTPSGGVVLDPFMGSGSTGIGAVMEGRDFIGIEQDADYIEIARRRIEHWQAEAEREAAQLELQFD